VPDETEVELESTEVVDNPEASEQTEVDEGPVEPEQMYTIKVDGEETQIPQSELVNGYQRQADYTRKTQELSAERERLQQAEAIVSALESNPEETLKVLARSFDIDTPAPSEVQGSEDWEEETPTDKRLTELEGKIARQESAQRQQVIENEVQRLQEKYGDFESRELLNHALKNQISNLDAAYTHWRFNDVKSTADKLQKEQEITNQKREAAVVTAGGSTQSGTQSKSESKASSIREAFELAKKQLST
jgi:hypothetical protein|tara:strand:- start:2 stop:745 length:744 start_codon:yes stop_codon:yes gene_type:complete